MLNRTERAPGHGFPGPFCDARGRSRAEVSW